LNANQKKALVSKPAYLSNSSDHYFESHPRVGHILVPSVHRRTEIHCHISFFNHHDASAGKNSPLTKRSKIILLAALIVSVVTIAVLRWANQEPAVAASTPIILFPPGYQIPTQGRNILDRVMPYGPSGNWLWKVRYALFGRTKVIHIGATFFDFPKSGLRVIEDLPPDLATPDGLQIWRLSGSQVSMLKIQAQNFVLSTPGIITGNNVRAGMVAGSSVLGIPRTVGVNIDVLPSMRRDTMDLIGVYSFSEAITNPSSPPAILIRTNFEFAARIQLPPEVGGILVLAPPPTSPNQPRIGLILTAGPAELKKN
jgi:hypothetical protein